MTAATTVVMTHPLWCKQGEECARPGMSIRHLGPVTAWSVTPTDDVDLTMQLVRHDEISAATAGTQLAGEARVKLTVTNTAFTHEDGSLVFADVEMDLENIDLLMIFLGRHRAEMAHPLASLEVPTDREAGR